MAKSWTDNAPSPKALAEHAHLRDPLSYRIKKFLLGAPLNRHSLGEQRLSKKNAFGVLSSDCISSSAYGGEQILVALIPAFGLAAFGLFTPILAVILTMLFIIALSYRDVINTYTKAGGAYIVARENLGINVSLIAAIELMFGYIITVAIQTAAGVAAIISAFPSLGESKVELTLGIILSLTFINLRGVKDAGVFFVIPSYLFIGSMLVVFVSGIYRSLNGTLPEYPTNTPGLLPLGEEQGLISFAAILMILKAFANGSASLTGLEAVSDSVPLFKSPEHLNARQTFSVMAMTLGLLVIGIGWLAYQTTAVPYQEGTPTVISLVAKASLGNTTFAGIFYLVVQAGTMLILFAGANTCYSAFPNMVRIVANDGYLPKWLTSRGHKLAFSNGILFIALFSSILVLVSGASITTLAAIYALAVFIGFSITGLGMSKKSKGESSARHLLHLLSGSISLITVAILSIAKFTEGTWLVVIGTPIVLIMMKNFNRRYSLEQEALKATISDSRATTIVRHDVTVLVDKVDVATIAAVRYARSLKPRNLHAVHFVLDDRRADRLFRAWNENPALRDVALELIDCPDRRLADGAVEYAIRATEKEDVELTLLIPRRSYKGVLGRLLHDDSAEQIARPISDLPRVVATIVPFDIERIIKGSREVRQVESRTRETKVVTPPVRTESKWSTSAEKVSHYQEKMTPIGSIQWRKRAHVSGKVTAIRPASMSAAPTLEIEIWDESGGVTLQFLGRREIAGLEVGSTLVAEGMVGEQNGALTILNPNYRIEI
ncbi:MAG: amino acid permease [Actinobacteria bacterium]|nr:amino acid permease [Actinomycetota bacterium]